MPWRSRYCSVSVEEGHDMNSRYYLVVREPDAEHERKVIPMGEDQGIFLDPADAKACARQFSALDPRGEYGVYSWDSSSDLLQGVIARYTGGSSR
jgi:hypothetical protein